MNWERGSIVFLCNPSFEPWGPDTLGKGMGGSEEAVVYLSREFAKRGYRVDVFSGRTSHCEDVFASEDADYYWPKYHPLTSSSPEDNFDVLVAWQTPINLPRVKARLKLMDLHGLRAPEELSQYVDHVDTFLFKSHFHRKKFPELPEDKCAVIGNGISQDHFATEAAGSATLGSNARGNSVGYFSSYDRGLHRLLTLWPKIRAEVPDATLDIYYGWLGWYGREGEPVIMNDRNVFMKELRDFIEERISELTNDGVTEHGRVSHEELARVMQRTKVWAYPTEAEEVFCITALKTQEAGCIPVVTNVGALPEVVHAGSIINCTDIYSNQEKSNEFVAAVVHQLSNGAPASGTQGNDWSDIADRWVQIIELERA